MLISVVFVSKILWIDGNDKMVPIDITCQIDDQIYPGCDKMVFKDESNVIIKGFKID